MVATEYHIPVLCAQAVELLYTRVGGIYVDATAGGGGHIRQMLTQNDAEMQLIAIDQDENALAQLPVDTRLETEHANFEEISDILNSRGIEQVDGILADLGVSSHHFDAPERGFSFRFDAPLDMRMNQQSDVTAATLLQELNLEELTLVFQELGELPRSYRLAQSIVETRSRQALETTADLNRLIEPLVPNRQKTNQYFAQAYQAIRMAVNRELEVLEDFLLQSLDVLAPGGALVVISYHSLEDRRVKHLLRSGNFEDERNTDLYGRHITPWAETSRKAIQADESEIAANPRARSAKLRYGIKA